jgi:GT2 family glycosyltransferase
MFSIIIPVQKLNDYIYETCDKLKNLKNKNFEILIFPDEAEKNDAEAEKFLNAKIIPTGKVSPALKRDLSLKYAQGEYLAFIDDDAYPDEKWLDVAEKYLRIEEVAAVGGSQLTPPEDSFWQKVSGAMFLSPLSGSARIRFWPGKKVREVEDWPTVNFIVKKTDFEKAGGFDSTYWPGEDTKLCLDIIKKLRKKILYIPELIVYHHRRAGIKKHLKQVGNYGLHRGFFAKKFPETSRKLMYFIPSIWVGFLILGSLVSVYSAFVLGLYLLGIAVYVAAILFSTLAIWQKTKNFAVSIATIPYLVLFHLWYGTRFIQGLVFTQELKSRLGK